MIENKTKSCDLEVYLSHNLHICTSSKKRGQQESQWEDELKKQKERQERESEKGTDRQTDGVNDKGKLMKTQRKRKYFFRQIKFLLKAKLFESSRSTDVTHKEADAEKCRMTKHFFAQNVFLRNS